MKTIISKIDRVPNSFKDLDNTLSLFNEYGDNFSQPMELEVIENINIEQLVGNLIAINKSIGLSRNFHTMFDDLQTIEVYDVDFI